LALKQFKTFFFIITLILFVSGFIVNDVYAQGGFVPCGNEGQSPCTICDIFVMIQRIINFLSYNIVPVLAAVFIIIGGLMMLMGGAKPDMFQRGKNIFKNTLIALLIIYGAWMITNTILLSLTNGDNGVDFRAWNQIDCQGGDVVVIPPPLSLPSELPGPGPCEFPAGCVDVDRNCTMNEIDCGAPENDGCGLCISAEAFADCVEPNGFGAGEAVTALVGQIINFGAFTNGIAPLSCSWHAEGASNVSSTSCFAFQTSYSSPGIYIINFTVTDEGGSGESDADACLVTVSSVPTQPPPPPPTVTATAPPPPPPQPTVTSTPIPNCATGAGIDPACATWSSSNPGWVAIASICGEKYPFGDAPSTDALQSCIGTKTRGKNVGTISTYELSISNWRCNYTRGYNWCGPCAHSPNSCHYGGRTGDQGALAIDYDYDQFKYPGVGAIIQKAAIECGAKAANCETGSGGFVECPRCVDGAGNLLESGPGCSNGGVTHVHVTAGDNNGAFIGCEGI